MRILVNKNERPFRNLSLEEQASWDRVTKPPGEDILGLRGLKTRYHLRQLKVILLDSVKVGDDLTLEEPSEEEFDSVWVGVEVQSTGHRGTMRLWEKT